LRVNRDLGFFIAGLCFGVAAGYFVFRAVLPPENPAEVVASSGTSTASTIGLDSETEFPPLDESQVRELEADAEASPDDPKLAARVGEFYMDAGQFADAVPWLEKAVELGPRDVHVRNHLALSYLNQGNMDGAVGSFEQTLAIDPNHPPSLLGLGRIKLYLQQDIDGGLAMWQKLMAVAPSSEEAQSVRDELDALKSAHPGS
jgi:tetratricopeptide (TPR) repeat protein